MIILVRIFTSLIGIGLSAWKNGLLSDVSQIHGDAFISSPNLHLR
jgi:hypothetical protein